MKYSKYQRSMKNSNSKIMLSTLVAMWEKLYVDRSKQTWFYIYDMLFIETLYMLNTYLLIFIWHWSLFIVDYYDIYYLMEWKLLYIIWLWSTESDYVTSPYMYLNKTQYISNLSLIYGYLWILKKKLGLQQQWLEVQDPRNLVLKAWSEVTI